MDGVVTSRNYHIAREQGVLIGRASCKHHVYTRLDYLAQPVKPRLSAL
jgi:hypothetical protein